MIDMGFNFGVGGFVMVRCKGFVIGKDSFIID